MQVEINDWLLRMIRQLAEDQDRSPTEVLEEALSLYMTFLAFRGEVAGLSEGSPPEGDSASIGKPIREGYIAGPEERPGSLEELFAIVDRRQREQGVEPLSEEEAMRLAVEEQRALRRETGRRTRVGK